MKLLRTVVAGLLVSAALSAGAQTIPVNTKPGEISREELAMTSYPLDTSATALVLYELQEVTVSLDDMLSIRKVTNYSVRFKVLGEEGKDVADFDISYDLGEFLNNVRVTTYNLDGGVVSKTRLEKKFIFTEPVGDDMFTCSFSAPDVRVGSVVEVSFIVESPYYSDAPTFYLQHEYPVNLARVSFSYPDILIYNRSFGGYLTPEYTNDSAAKFLASRIVESCNILTDKFSLKDVPAMRQENRSMCPAQFMSKVSYELSGVTIPGFLYKSFASRWNDVDDVVRESRIVSQCVVGGRVLERFRVKGEDEISTVEAVRKSILGAVKWNGKNSVVPVNVTETLKEGSGSSASVNAVVASVLNSMGYKVSPVLLRRRSRGYLENGYVRLSAFTDMILQVETPSGKKFFYDASSDAGYPDVIDPQYFVLRARVVPCNPSEPGEWVDLTPLAKGTTAIIIKSSLSADGLVGGNMTMRFFNSDSYLVKQTYQKLGSDEKYIEFLEEGENFETKSFTVDASAYSSQASLHLDFSQDVTAGGDMVYINPFLVRTHHKSDFPVGERHTPVDFVNAGNLNYTYIFTVPEGYELVETPPAKSFRSPVFSGRAVCQSTVRGDVVTVSFSYRNTSLMVPAESYDELRAFWEQLCDVYEGVIVLKKK